MLHLLITIIFCITSLSHVDAKEQVTINSKYAPLTLRSDSNSIFTPRDAHSAYVVGDKLLVLAGENTTRGALNDVWISSPPDSGIFTQVNVTAGFTPRADHSTVVLGDKVIIMAGQLTRQITYNDVWSSSDLGKTWVQETASAPWAGRIGAMAVVLGTDILLIGGYMSTSVPPLHCSEVWKSADGGKNWVLVSNNTFPGRADAQVAVIGNTLVMTGGENGPPNTTYADVYQSTDAGLTWKQVLTNAEWGPRFQHTMITVGDQLVITCGLKNTFTSFYNDVWASRDQGLTWKLITSNATSAGRAHTDADVWINAKKEYAFILTGGNNGGGSQVWLAEGQPLLITNINTAINTYVINWITIVMCLITIITMC